MGNKHSLTETSRFIALILRHKPEEIGITLDEHGWANVQERVAAAGEKVCRKLAERCELL